MEFFKIKRDIPFMRYGKLTTTISLITFIFAILSLAFKGLNLGIDFTGGMLIEVSYPQPANLDEIRKTLEEQEVAEVAVQSFGTSKDVLIRVPLKGEANSTKMSEQLFSALKAQDAAAELRRVEFVGPHVRVLPMGIHLKRARRCSGHFRIFGKRVGGSIRPSPRKLPQDA
jgi:preprotein translocase subunit SecF